MWIFRLPERLIDGIVEVWSARRPEVLEGRMWWRLGLVKIGHNEGLGCIKEGSKMAVACFAGCCLSRSKRNRERILLLLNSRRSKMAVVCSASCCSRRLKRSQGDAALSSHELA